jgi:hypothetical protein
LTKLGSKDRLVSGGDEYLSLLNASRQGTAFLLLPLAASPSEFRRGFGAWQQYCDYH